MKTTTSPTTATRTARSFATITALSLAALLTSQTATSAEQSRTTKVKSKQCVMLYSPQYKKLRIKPIQFSFRWCSAANPNDCTKWKNDRVVDSGKPYTIVAHCFTHHAPIKMELRYNRRFDEFANQASTSIKPHAIQLKDNLAPHPFCAKQAAHRFVMQRGGAQLKSGKPRNVREPKCTWKPIKLKVAS